MFSRRDLMKSALVGAGAFGFGRVNPDFLFTSALAADNRAVRFLGAEALTGNWDPTTHTNLGQLIVEGFVFGYLTRAPMRPEKPDELVFELAESLTPIDFNTMEVKLRKGIKFHDGTPLTAADVKATYEYGSQPDRPAQWYPGLVKIDVIDDHTCHINTKEAGYPAALYYYLSSFLPIMSAKDVANKAQLSARMNGTGPFKYIEQKGDTTVLAANPDFFMGSPKVPGVEYHFVGDTTTRTLSLLNGEADIIERLEAEQVDTIAKDARFAIHKAVSVENKYLFFRCSKKPFDDPRIRLAACHSIDRKQVLEILGVSGTYSKAHISPVKFGYTEVPNYPEFDAVKAQALLAEAGFPKGEGLPELTYYSSVGFYPKTKEYAELITGMLQEQGFKVNLQTLEVAAWGNLLYDKPGGGEGNMIDCGWCTGSPEPDLVLRTHLATKMGLRDPIIVQYARYMGGLLHGDLGQSYLRPKSGMVAAGGQYVDPTKSDMAPVTDLIVERLPFTLQLGGVALVLAFLMSFPIGVAGGLHQHGWQNAVAFGVQSLFVSIPNFWLAIILILFLSVKLNLLPALGYQGFSYVLLPAFVLAVEITPFLVRTLTTSLGEVMQAGFIDEARVRGLSRRRIVYSHALRNAAVPLVNLLGIQLSTLIGGVLVIEYIFDYPGLGNLTVVSVVGRDFPTIQGIAITTSAVFVFINIIVDLVAYMIDPRVEL